ncbi:MAG: SCO family protein [Myxococcales bacterium]|nr:SCO family protein [Myxococcales bacterium]MDH5306630.1 SCO family protein [Myxococcales bacterium]MDH5565230.1 SCO family protein [Myxococcales bacterium]
MNAVRGVLERIRCFIEGGGFPATTLCLIVFYELLLLGLLLTPPGGGELGDFAEEFRVWCFGYDPATGGMQWAYVMAMLAPQLMLGAVVALFWWEPLRAVWAQPRRFARYAAAAAALIAVLASGMIALGSAPARGELPFPAEALRTAQAAPELTLVNQAGARIDLASMRGKVVLLTAMYATCGHTCPLILAQSKAAVGALTDAEREDLRVVAVTLDPEHDSIQVLAQLGRLQSLSAPLYNLVTGDPVAVGRVLDKMDVARSRDPETGIIDHAAVFLLIDRGGRVAYRLGLGPRQERWLTTALRVLLQEPIASG